MQLGITIPLQNYLKLPKPPYPQPDADLRLCWDLHVLKTGHCHALLGVHCSSRYTLLLYGLSRAEWADAPAVFMQQLAYSLEAEGYTATEIARYFALAGEGAVLTKTHGRKPVAHLNRAVEDMYALPAGLDEATLLQPQVRICLNDMICHAAGHEGYGTPRAFLHTDMGMLLENS